MTVTFAHCYCRISAEYHLVQQLNDTQIRHLRDRAFAQKMDSSVSDQGKACITEPIQGAKPSAAGLKNKGTRLSPIGTSYGAAEPLAPLGGELDDLICQ